jgi:signal transduction histidine kinase
MATVGPALEDAFEVARPGAEAANIDLRASHVDEVAPVACPPGVLASVLNNLVQNAVKYMGTSPERVVEVVAEERGDDVEIAVRDTGPGISPEVQKRIFEPFVRATAGAAAGVGLGLSIVRRMVEAYGGAVAVTSQPGRGTTFWVRLPRADAPVHG